MEYWKATLEMNMKQNKIAIIQKKASLLLIALVVSLAGIVRAESLVSAFVPPLSADTETSTNLPVPSFANCNVFKVQFKFDATPSNSVQVAFGQDIDYDGNLSLRESCMMLGWSGGEWFIRRKGYHVWEHYAETSTTGSRTLELQRRLQHSAPNQTFSMKLDGGIFSFENGTEGWLSLADLEGGLVRVVTRGVGITGQAVIETEADAKVMVLR